MKRQTVTRKLWQWGTMMLSIVSCISLMLAPLELFAKVAIKKPTGTIDHFNGFSSKEDGYILACEGYYTYITTDADGKTQVYVNDSGSNSYSTDEDYRVELPEGITWDRVTIYGGKSNAGTCTNVNIKMDGGCVSDINLGPEPSKNVSIENKVTGNATLNITSGTVYSIGDFEAVNGNINLYFSNLNYTGPEKIEIPAGKKAKTHIMINNNCTFYAPLTKLVAADVSGCLGAFIPSATDYRVMEAYGAAIIPANHTVNCSTLNVENTLSVGGTLNVYIGSSIRDLPSWRPPSNVSTIFSGTIKARAGALRAECSHEYQIKSIDYVSPYTPEEGMLTMECTKCHKVYPYFQFSLMNYTPGYSYEHPELGYWYKAVPVKTLELPTCIPGWGIYEVTLNYLGQKITKQYENIIRPSGNIHNYGVDGICHETHYKLYYKEDQPGVIVKDGMGNIEYDVDNDGKVLVDNATTYNAVAYIAVAKQVQYWKSRIAPCTDPEYSLTYDPNYPLTYTDWEVTNFNAINATFFNKVKEELEAGNTVAIGMYENTNNTPICLTDPNIAFISTAGHTFAAKFEDAEAYTHNTSFDASELIYTRDCTAALAGKWQALMVPFSIEMTEDVLEKCDIAELYMISTKGSASGGMSDGGNGQPDVAVLTKFALGDVTPASTPLFIRPKQAGTLSIVQNDVEVDAANQIQLVSCATTKDSYEMHGVYDGTFVNPNDGNLYYALSSGAITLFNPSAKLSHPNRWYLKKESKSSMHLTSFNNLLMHTFGEDNADGYNDIDFIEEAAQNNSSTFNIYGHVVKDGGTLAPGFYVKNHKKILVK